MLTRLIGRQRRTFKAGLSFVYSALIGIALADPVIAQTTSTGVFPSVGRVEGELVRGSSRKTDVLRVLGTPDGSGSAVLPPDLKSREIWYYEDIEVTGMKSEGGGVIRASTRQQIILVFFDNEVFDGFMWFSNAGTAEPLR